MEKTEEQTNKRGLTVFIGLCALAYFVSYLSRLNLGVVLLELVQSGFSTKEIVSLALTASSIVYGTGQLVSGYLGSRFRPEAVIRTGFLITAIINFSVAFLKNSAYLIPLWAINGFAQALMYPPLVRIMAKHLDFPRYVKGTVYVSYGGNLGTVAIYLFAPLLILLWGVKSVFLFAGIMAALMCLFWNKTLQKSAETFQISDTVETVREKQPDALNTKEEKTPRSRAFWILSGLIILAIALQGMLRDGVTAWMPTYVAEMFDLGSGTAILSGVVMPLFSVLSLKIAHLVYTRWLRNELVCAGAFFVIGTAAALLLGWIGGSSAALSVVLLALLVGSMHNVNLILIGFAPPRLSRFADVAVLTGVYNAATYVGASISTYGIAVYSASYGWTATVFLWMGIAAMGAGICFACFKSWKILCKK